ncbi:winged helix-turn-helix transcriptional regulator [Streptomyces sp. NPDC015032]|uniref:winged helix-turn-helix transcriptional regulator n=1 Tax=Streptomyces sp. NPDC015032 TaxID=3364937 RepID=UPI0036FF0C6B
MTTTGLSPATDADVARVTEALGMMTPRWNVRILLALSGRPQRYTELAARLPWLQSGQLHPRVRSLCDSGLLERVEHSQRHVTYGLTERGAELLPVLPLIAGWADRSLEKPDTPTSAIENIEDSLTLLTRRHATTILWVLKSRQETSARALASIVIPDGYWTSIYPPLRQLVDDGLVTTAGAGQPYRLSEAGDGLGGVFGALSAWSAGRPLTHTSQHPVWGHNDHSMRTGPQTQAARHSRRPAPMTAAPTRSAHHPAWQNRDLFSHTAPSRPKAVLTAGGPGR